MKKLTLTTSSRLLLTALICGAIVFISPGCRLTHKVFHKKPKKYNPLSRCCFTKGTKILLSDGTQKNIEAIQPGDLILNVSRENYNIDEDCVMRIDSVIHGDLAELELANGIMIRSTRDHPYLIEGKGWCSLDPRSSYKNYGISALEIKTGDRCLVYTNGQLIPIVIRAIRQVKETLITYNIGGLKYNSSYFANRILVSNETLVDDVSKK